MKRPMYHALEINKANEELAAENLRLLEQIKELETARESDLAFFGATLEEDGGLHIDMKKYHAAHICKEHQWLPKEERLIEDRCPICIKSQIDDLERQLAEVRSPSTTPTDLTEQARQLVERCTDSIPMGDKRFDALRVNAQKLVPAIAAFAAEAATQGQQVGIERAEQVVNDYFNLKQQQWYEKYGRVGVYTAIHSLSPDPNYLDRVRNEAATAERERILKLVPCTCPGGVRPTVTVHHKDCLIAAIGDDEQEGLEFPHGKSGTPTPEAPGRKTTSTS